MYSVPSSLIIDIWERGRVQHPIDRALTILSMAGSGMSRHELADLPIGSLNALLLLVYRQLFGNTLACLANCPDCGEGIEFSISAKDMQTKSGAGKKVPAVVDESGYQIEFQLPNSRDLAAIVRSNSVSSGRNEILKRCIIKATSNDNDVNPAVLPEQVVEKISRKIAECDPLADIQLNMNCPACSHTWQSSLNIVSFLWEKITFAAKRLLYEIHTLASAYGWSESEILSLSPLRRQHYMEMVL